MNEKGEEAAASWLSMAQGMPSWPNSGERLVAMWSKDRTLLATKELLTANPLDPDLASDFYRLIGR